MKDQSLINTISEQMNLELPVTTSFEEMRAKLQTSIQMLIETDFQKLVNVLYRIDVNERKLKYLLQENVGEDAAIIIADLIIERQIEKLKARNNFRKTDDDINDEEKW